MVILQHLPHRAAWRILLAAVIGWLTPGAWAVEPDLSKEFSTDVWETADGLPQGTVTCLAQTKDGYLWMGTPNGLVRFDGAEFRVLDPRNTPAMRSRRVNALLADFSGGLWIGLEDGGALYMTGGKFTLLDAARGLTDEDVRCFGRDGGGSIYIGTATGVFRWTGGNLTKMTVPAPAAALLQTGAGALWMLSAGQAVRADGTGIRGLENEGLRWNGLAASYADNLWVFGTGLLRVAADGTAGLRQDVEMLPHDEITAVCERSNGEVWLGTRQGLIRRLSGGPGRVCRLLAGRPVRCLLEDAERNLWIGTDGGGLARLKPKRVLSYGIQDGLPGESVTAFCPDGRRNFWVGCGADGIAHWDAGRFTRFDAGGALPANLVVTALLRARDGSLWIGAEGMGLLRWKDGTLERFGTEQGLTEPRILSMLELPDSTLVFGGAGRGLWQWSEEGIRHYGAADGMDGENISAIVPAPGGCWIGSNQNGLYRFQNGGFARFTTAGGPGSDFVRTLYYDSDDVLWIGTDAGVTRLKAGKFFHFSTRHGLWDDVISRIVDDGLMPSEGGQNLWFGSNRGIFRVARAAFDELVSGARTSLQPVIYGRAEGMDCLECSGGFGPAGLVEHLTPNPGMENPRLWFPTLRGLVSLDAIRLMGRTDGIMGDHTVFYRPQLHSPGTDAVFDLGDAAAGGNGTLTGTSAGLDLTSGTPVQEWSNVIVTDPAGMVASRYHRTALPFVDGVFIPDGGLAVDRMVTISSTGLKVELPDTNGRTWGFLKSGVKVPPEEMFDPADAVHLGARMLWMPGNQGISFSLEAIRRATGRSMNRFTARVCNLHVGSSTYHVFVDGRLAAWRSGLTRDFYQSLEQNSIPVEAAIPGGAKFLTIVTTDNKDDPGGANLRPPPVLIEEVLEDGQRRAADADGTFTAGPGSGGVEIRFTALSLVAAEKVRFRHRLEPLDKEWMESGGIRAVQYPKLPPGDYRFQVIACNNDGVWNESGASIQLTVRPHFWETWWFTPAWILLLCAAAGGTAILTLRARHRRRIAGMEQQHALEQERARIARDIHDDLGASLTNIALLSELALSDLDQPPSARQHLDAIFTAAQRVARSVDEIVWAINPKNDALERSLAYICKSAQDFLRPSGLQCRLEMPGEFPACFLTSSVRHNLYLSVREALHNAVKHSGSREVKLQVSLTESGLIMEIADHGRGFDAAAALEQPSVRHGLANMRRRMEMVGGTFSVTSRPGAGAVVRLAVPLALARPGEPLNHP